jgi:Ca-activated chloride channel homolog
MTRIVRPLVSLTALAVSGALALTACGGDDDPTTSPPETRGVEAEAYYDEYDESSDSDMMASAPGGAMADLAGDGELPDIPGPTEDNTFVDAGTSGFVETGADNRSTFALDVDTGSYTVAQAFLAQGYRPEPDSVRPEEWVNSFDYGDPAADDTALAATVEAGVADGGEPALVRIGVATVDLGDEARPPANITFVIDTSGSMDIRDRLGLVKSSLALLVRQLRTDDTIAIVTYGDDAAPVLAPTPIAEWREIVDAIDSLQPGGSTNMEAGLRMGYEQARDSFDPETLNVVVLASDGVANQGVTDADELTASITQAGEEGIHLVTVGYGMGNYNDHLMEQLADQGDGFYSYVDTYAEAVRLFVTELTPTLTVVAAEAKVQVVFDSDVVARYRLIGYENRELDDSDFRDDAVDAGELGAGHRISAVYELELVDGADDNAIAGEVRLRWADPDTGAVTETETPIELGSETSDSLRLATLVAHTAEVLKGGEAVTDRGITLESLLADAEALAADGVDGADDIAELITLAIHAEPPTSTDG